MSESRKRLDGLNDQERKRLQDGIMAELAKMADTKLESISGLSGIGQEPVSDRVLEIIARGRKRQASASRAPLRGVAESGNPFVSVISGELNSVPVEVEVAGRQIRGNICGPRTVGRATDATERLDIKPELSLAAAGSLSAEKLDDEELLRPFQPGGDGPAGNEPSKLTLELTGWPEGHKLLDVVARSESDADADEFQAVMTVRQIDTGFELTADAEDMEIFQEPTMAIELRILGGDHHE